MAESLADIVRSAALEVAQAHVAEAAFVDRTNKGQVRAWCRTHTALQAALASICAHQGLDAAAVTPTPDSVGGNKPPNPQ